MKFCCDRFKQDLDLDHRARPNIRIVKININEVPGINPKYPYRFYLTVGYEKGEKNVPSRSINYCPYCGKSLRKYYKSDDYINEYDHTFLYF